MFEWPQKQYHLKRLNVTKLLDYHKMLKGCIAQRTEFPASKSNAKSPSKPVLEQRLKDSQWLFELYRQHKPGLLFNEPAAPAPEHAEDEEKAAEDGQPPRVSLSPLEMEPEPKKLKTGERGSADKRTPARAGSATSATVTRPKLANTPTSTSTSTSTTSQPREPEGGNKESVGANWESVVAIGESLEAQAETEVEAAPEVASPAETKSAEKRDQKRKSSRLSTPSLSPQDMEPPLKKLRTGEMGTANWKTPISSTATSTTAPPPC